MNIVLLNPPNKHRIQRRFMCSYNAPNQLLPPQELMALGGMLRKQDNCKIFLIDAIAENLNTLSVIERLKSLQPDVIVAIQGFECFEEDIHVLTKIKQSLPSSRMVLFGHYATLFPEEILENTNFDIIIIGEPDNIFSDLGINMSIFNVRVVKYKILLCQNKG